MCLVGLLFYNYTQIWNPEQGPVRYLADRGCPRRGDGTTSFSLKYILLSEGRENRWIGPLVVPLNGAGLANPMAIPPSPSGSVPPSSDKSAIRDKQHQGVEIWRANNRKALGLSDT